MLTYNAEVNQCLKTMTCSLFSRTQHHSCGVLSRLWHSVTVLLSLFEVSFKMCWCWCRHFQDHDEFRSSKWLPGGSLLFYVFLLKYRGPSLWLSVHSHSVARPSCLCFWGYMEKVCTIVSEHGEKSKAACIPSVSCVVVICWVCEAMFQKN